MAMNKRERARMQFLEDFIKSKGFEIPEMTSNFFDSATDDQINLGKILEEACKVFEERTLYMLELQGSDDYVEEVVDQWSPPLECNHEFDTEDGEDYITHHCVKCNIYCYTLHEDPEAKTKVLGPHEKVKKDLEKYISDAKRVQAYSRRSYSKYVESLANNNRCKHEVIINGKSAYCRVCGLNVAKDVFTTYMNTDNIDSYCDYYDYGEALAQAVEGARHTEQEKLWRKKILYRK